jgi:hypothetical protein
LTGHDSKKADYEYREWDLDSVQQGRLDFANYSSITGELSAHAGPDEIAKYLREKITYKEPRRMDGLSRAEVAAKTREGVCQDSNTILLYALRERNIPSVLALGHKLDGHNMTTKTGHAIVLAKWEGKWRVYDATAARTQTATIPNNEKSLLSYGLEFNQDAPYTSKAKEVFFEARMEASQAATQALNRLEPARQTELKKVLTKDLETEYPHIIRLTEIERWRSYDPQRGFTVAVRDIMYTSQQASATAAWLRRWANAVDLFVDRYLSARMEPALENVISPEDIRLDVPRVQYPRAVRALTDAATIQLYTPGPCRVHEPQLVELIDENGNTIPETLDREPFYARAISKDQDDELAFKEELRAQFNISPNTIFSYHLHAQTLKSPARYLNSPELLWQEHMKPKVQKYLQAVTSFLQEELPKGEFSLGAFIGAIGRSKELFFAGADYEGYLQDLRSKAGNDCFDKQWKEASKYALFAGRKNTHDIDHNWSGVRTYNGGSSASSRGRSRESAFVHDPALNQSLMDLDGYLRHLDVHPGTYKYRLPSSQKSFTDYIE